MPDVLRDMNVSRGVSRELVVRARMLLLLGALCASIGAAAAGQQVPPAGTTPAAGEQPPGGARGGGGGRGNAAATLFASTCAPCHGTDLAGGRAPTLFSERLLASNDDDALVAKIRDGVPNTAMVPFKGTLDEQQIQAVADYVSSVAGK